MNSGTGSTPVAAGHCLNCGCHEGSHVTDPTDVFERLCLDCECQSLRICGACDGDPEAHDLHVCGRTT